MRIRRCSPRCGARPCAVRPAERPGPGARGSGLRQTARPCSPTYPGEPAVPRRSQTAKSQELVELTDPGSAQLDLALQIPRLAGELLAELLVRLAGDELEAGALVDAARSDQYAGGPQRHLVVAGVAGKAYGLVDQPRADANPARLALHQQQPQPCHLVAVLDDEHRADVFAVALGDPAALALGIEIAHEGGDDLGGERLEAVVPAIFAAVDQAVLGDDPAHVAGARRPQNIGSVRGRRLTEQPF